MELIPDEADHTFVDVVSVTTIVKTYGAHLKASAATVRLRLYDVLALLPPETYEGITLLSCLKFINMYYTVIVALPSLCSLFWFSCRYIPKVSPLRMPFCVEAFVSKTTKLKSAFMSFSIRCIIYDHGTI